MTKRLASFLLAGALLLNLGACNLAQQEVQKVPQEKSEEQLLVEAPQSAERVANLEKLCKVWGYAKYHHPAFLQGEKDWDEELLNLIPAVSSAKEEEVGGILHQWFVSLGETDFSGKRASKPLETQSVVQADTSWITDVDYLGEELSADLQQLGAIPGIDRSKAPVKFSSSIPDFSNEKTDPSCSYQKEEERLLGLFRVWNAIEYYFPYLDIMDESWHELLKESIPKVLEASDQQSFELALYELIAHLHDVHVEITPERTLSVTYGSYIAPVDLLRTKEGQWVVCDLFGLGNSLWDCPLQMGDVILKLDGQDIKEVENDRKKYLSVPNDEKLYKRVYGYLLRSQDEEMEITVLRDGEEQTVTVKGTSNLRFKQRQKKESHQILDGNIGLINPEALPEGGVGAVVSRVMTDLRDTDGLIVDLRQYPSQVGMHTCLAMFLQKKGVVFETTTMPSQSVPGTYIKNNVASYGSASMPFYYEKPVVVLMSETSMSNAEYSIMDLRTGDHVTVLGNPSVGADGTITKLPLPNGYELIFTSVGIYTPEMGQTQRVGLSPDIEVYPTVEGIKEGRDELMEAAIAYLKQ